MKITCVLGSPRPKSNSATLAQWFLDAAARHGAETATFTLNKLDYQGCQGCNACKSKLDHCALEDDLAAVLESARNSDVLVMATPIYFGEVSSQLKGFIDRCYSYAVPDFITAENKTRLTPNKTLVFVTAQFNPVEENFSDVYPRYSGFFKMLGFVNSHNIRALGVGAPGEVAARTDLKALAEEIAAKICG